MQAMVAENNREADRDRNNSKSTQFKRTPDGVKTKRMLEVEDKIGTTLEDDYINQYLYGDLGQKRLANRWEVGRALIFGDLRGGRRSWIQMLGLPKREHASDKTPAGDARRGASLRGNAGQAIGVLKLPPKTKKLASVPATEIEIRKNLAFVDMPMSAEQHDLIDVLDSIKEACDRCGIQAE